MRRSFPGKRNRKRKQPDLQIPLAIKKRKYQFQRKFTSNCDIEYDNVDQAIAFDLFETIRSCLHTISSKDIIHTITEYSFGWIKYRDTYQMCHEILIIPSSFKNILKPLLLKHHIKKKKILTIPEVSNNHNNNFEKKEWFIHLCETCDVDIYAYMAHTLKYPWEYNFSWWISCEATAFSNRIYIERNINTTACGIEYSHSCVECRKIQCQRDMSITPELCIKCSYKCSSCSNVYCVSKHEDLYCKVCDVRYCKYCTAWMKNAIADYIKCFGEPDKYYECINCCVGFDDICGGEPAILPPVYLKVPIVSSLRDMYETYKMLQILHQSDSIKKYLNNENNITKHKIINLICEYGAGHLVECAEEYCDGEVSIIHGKQNYFISFELTCNVNNDDNYLHYCDYCYSNYWVNTISSYDTFHFGVHTTITSISRHPAENWQSNAYNSKRIHICASCMVNRWKVKKLCEECRFICGYCKRTLCLDHLANQCNNCGSKYCYEDKFIPIKQCQFCGLEICVECQVFYGDYDDDYCTVDCYNEFKLCKFCYCPFISDYYTSKIDYQASLSKIKIYLYTEFDTSYDFLRGMVEPINLIACFIS